MNNQTFFPVPAKEQSVAFFAKDKDNSVNKMKENVKHFSANANPTAGEKHMMMPPLLSAYLKGRDNDPL